MKNIFKKYIIVFVSLCTIICLSCKKNGYKDLPQTSKDSLLIGANLLDIIESYYKLQTTKVQGTFMFESMVPNNDSKVKNTVLLGGNFYDEDAHTRLFGGTTYIGNNKLEPNAAGTYGFDQALSRDGLFGTNVTFTLSPRHYTGNVLAASGRSTTMTTHSSTTQGDGGSGSISTTIYSPIAISITNVPPQTPVTLVPNNPLIITWNTDPNNQIGVSIIAEYIPLRASNITLMAAGYNTVLTKSILVPDNGTTALPWSFFSQFPIGCNIILWVARGNYTILSDGTYNYQVGGYSAAAVWEVTVPQPILINGTYGFTFNAATTSGSGTITGPSGKTITVTAVVGGGASVNVFQLSGANFVTNTSSPSNNTLVANSNVPNGTTQTATFVMPASGSVTWSGNCSPDNNGNGGGNIFVQ